MVQPCLLRQVWNDRRDGSHEHSQGLARHLHRGQSRWRRRFVAVEPIFDQVAVHGRNCVRQEVREQFVHVVILITVVQTLNLRRSAMLTEMFYSYSLNILRLRKRIKRALEHGCYKAEDEDFRHASRSRVPLCRIDTKRAACTCPGKDTSAQPRSPRCTDGGHPTGIAESAAIFGYTRDFRAATPP